MIDKLFTNLPFLMGAPEGAAGAGGLTSNLLFILPIAVIILVFYFLIIRPQNKKQKALQQMLSQLKKGDKVSTIGGIHGVVTAVKEQTIVVKVDDNTKMEFTKNAIAQVIDKKGGESIEDKTKKDKKR